MKFTMRKMIDGTPVQIEVIDQGLRRFKGRACYTARYVVPGRKRAIVGRVDRHLADLAADRNAFRLSEDLALLETFAGLTF